ncbi:MAG TPA: T3SS effector HopA1 family protein [Candidatus Angelobacter sp.]|nr:T3SS effector HopA1 family protein [Candidatus Angelobacter sp.]
MSESIIQTLQAVVSAVNIHSASSFSFAGGAPVNVGPNGFGQPKEVPPQTPAQPLIQALQSTLYSSCYVRPFDPSGSFADLGTLQAAFDPGFHVRLSQANGSRDRWEPGWTIHQLGQGGMIFVHKGERHRAVQPGEFAGAGMAPQPNQMVSLQVLRESFQLQPGFYFVFGETISDQYDDFSMVRFYFHLKPEGAPLLIKKLTTDLNLFQIPFRMKCLTDPAQYVRSDSAVLYVSRRFFRITAALLAPLAEAPWLRPATPFFTRKLAPGLAVAEDPGNGESFGMHRCRMVAEGVVDAWLQGTQSPEARMAAVRQRFLQNGIALERPYMSTASQDVFEFPAPVEFSLEKSERAQAAGAKQ